MSKINKNVRALCAIAAIALPVNGETPKVQIKIIPKCLKQLKRWIKCQLCETERLK